MNYFRGSEWSKWDLHIHTPFSIFQLYGGDSPDVWNKYLDDLEKLPEEFKVLGINDYLFLDGYEKLMIEKSNGRLSNIDLLLPVIEFRLEKFAGVEFKDIKRINLHVIFSNDLPLETIKSQFLNTLEQSYTLTSGDKWTRAINKESLKELGKKIKESIPPEKLGEYGTDIDEGFNNLNLDEKTIFNPLKKDCFKGKFLIAIGKTEWDELKWSDASIASKKSIINESDIIFTASENTEKFQNAKNKLTSQGVKDLLLDCSDAHTFSDSQNKERIGNCFTWIKSNPTFEGLKQIIYVPSERIRIQETNPELEKNHWKILDIEILNSNIDLIPDQKIEFNSGLNSIIGGRGTGKSGLLSLISSLNGDGGTDKFLSWLRELGDFEIKVSLLNKDGNLEEYNGKLSEEHNFSLPIFYLSQEDIEKFSNENKKEEYRKKFLQVIGIEDTSYYYNGGILLSEELIEDLKRLDNEEKDIFSNINYIIIQKKILNTSSISYLDKLAEIEKILKNEKEKYSTGRTKVALEKISQIVTKGNKLNLLIQSDLTDRVIQSAKNLNMLIEEYNKQFLDSEFSEQYKSSVKKLDKIDISSTSNLIKRIDDNKKITESYRDTLRKECKPFIQQLKDAGILDYKNITGAIEEIDKLLLKISDFKLKLQDIQKSRDEIYKKLLRILSDYKNSISYAKTEIESKFLEFTDGRNNLFNKIFEGVSVSPDVYFSKIDFLTQVTDCFYKGKHTFLNSYLDNITLDFNSFFDTFNDLNFFKLLSENRDFFKVQNGDSYYYLLSLIFNKCMTSFIFVQPKIELGGRELGMMSGGQQATLMLKLKLASEGLNKDIIVLDQPENHLDNKFIKDNLVQLIKNLKREKQVIIASHNANLVIGADSEEIIVARMDDTIDKTYTSGGIENPVIQKIVIDTLEGGEEAFLQRKDRYSF